MSKHPVLERKESLTLPSTSPLEEEGRGEGARCGVSPTPAWSLRKPLGRLAAPQPNRAEPRLDLRGQRIGHRLAWPAPLQQQNPELRQRRQAFIGAQRSPQPVRAAIVDSVETVTASPASTGAWVPTCEPDEYASR